jgi:hypothetical protein
MDNLHFFVTAAEKSRYTPHLRCNVKEEAGLPAFESTADRDRPGPEDYSIGVTAL